MKTNLNTRMLKMLVVTASLGLTVAACSFDGDDDDSDSGGNLPAGSAEFNSGTYTVSNHTVIRNQCGNEPFSDGDQVFVTARGKNLLFRLQAGDEIQASRNGNSISGYFNEDISLSDMGLNCVLDVTVTVGGKVIAANVGEIRSTVRLDRKSGTQCGALEMPLPCETTEDVTLTGDDKGGDQPPTGPCEADEVRDCVGVAGGSESDCAPADYLNDGFCDDGSFGFDLTCHPEEEEDCSGNSTAPGTPRLKKTVKVESKHKSFLPPLSALAGVNV